jgi:hypothetical protein
MASISQHKRMAMGEKVTGMKKGGAVAGPARSMNAAPNMNKTGIPQNPLTTQKANNGIPGMKKGGSMKGC